MQYYIICMSYSRLPNFSNSVFQSSFPLWFRIQSRITLRIQFSRLFNLILSKSVAQPFLVFPGLDIFLKEQASCLQHAPTLDLSVFPHDQIKFRLCIFGENTTTTIPCPSQGVRSEGSCCWLCHQWRCPLPSLATVAPASFSTNVSPFSLYN